MKLSYFTFENWMASFSGSEISRLFIILPDRTCVPWSLEVFRRHATALVVDYLFNPFTNCFYLKLRYSFY